MSCGPTVMEYANGKAQDLVYIDNNLRRTNSLASVKLLKIGMITSKNQIVTTVTTVRKPLKSSYQSQYVCHCVRA